MSNQNPMAFHQNQADERKIKKLASRYRAINIGWIIISILLFGTVVGSIAALWNLYAVYTRWKIPSMIEARDPRVPAIYGNDAGWFITLLVVNVALGGVIGAALIGYEYFFVRREILNNRHLFSGLSRARAVA